MKIVLFVLAALCLSQVTLGFDVFDELPPTDEEVNCIEEVLRDTTIDTEHVGDFAQEAQDVINRLLDQRQRCTDILSDPPTALEERLYEACRVAWTASVIFELNRLRDQSQSRDFFDDMIRRVEECRNAF